MVKRIVFVLLPFLVLIGLYFSLKDVDFQSAKNEDSLPSKVTVYTYSSFASSWGAGNDLKKLFKEMYNLEVEFVDAGEAGILLQRLTLEGSSSLADVVLGIDQFSLADAIQKLKWKPLPAQTEATWDSSFPVADQKVADFGAYNWAPMTFIYRNQDIVPPKTLKDLMSSRYQKSFSIMDPRTSSPGYIFFHWVVQKLGAEGAKQFFKSLKPNIVTVSPSWSAGYGLFTKNQAKLVFSYLTSPVYHWVEEKKPEYQPVYLQEPLPYHVEYVAIPNSCKNCEGAEKFIRFLYTENAQRAIMSKNYMLPVVANVSMGSEFSKLKPVELFKPKQDLPREQVIQIWKSLEL